MERGDPVVDPGAVEEPPVALEASNPAQTLMWSKQRNILFIRTTQHVGIFIHAVVVVSGALTVHFHQK